VNVSEDVLVSVLPITGTYRLDRTLGQYIISSGTHTLYINSLLQQELFIV